VHAGLVLRVARAGALPITAEISPSSVSPSGDGGRIVSGRAAEGTKTTR
jgi:hypothetical protein